MFGGAGDANCCAIAAEALLQFDDELVGILMQEVNDLFYVI